MEAKKTNVFCGAVNKCYPVVERAKGAKIFSKDGRVFIDCAAGAAVTNIGQGLDEVIDAIEAQGRRVSYVYGATFTSDIREELAEHIIRMAPEGMERVFFCSGGSEAVESIIKIARQYQIEAGRPGKYKIISRWQSYHGNTAATLSVGGRPSWRAKYEPILNHMPHISSCNCYRCPYGLQHPECNLACANELERVIKYEGPDTVAAFLLEPIIGTTATATVPADGYFQRVREICDQYDILLCCDEVITGFGRTGKNFAVEHFGVTPDLISCAKGLGGGYVPIGAVIAHKRVVEAFSNGSGRLVHSYTFGGMPLVCAGANAVLTYLEKNHLVERAGTAGQVFMEKLKAKLEPLPIVGEIRGKGLLIGVELVQNKETKEPFDPSRGVAGRVAEYCFQQGVILLSGVIGTADGVAGEALQLSPPFVIDQEEMDTVVEVLHDALCAVWKAETTC